jgi:hypothetical protein
VLFATWRDIEHASCRRETASDPLSSCFYTPQCGVGRSFDWHWPGRFATPHAPAQAFAHTPALSHDVTCWAALTD